MTLAGYYFCKFTLLQYLDFCLRLVLAFIIGGVIGLERSNRFKEAGIRTHIMVCVASALIMLISKYGFADMDWGPGMDYFGTKHAKDGNKDELEYGVGCGEVLDVPTLDESPWVYECEVAKSVETGESTTFFCPIRNIQMDENVNCEDTFDVDLTLFDPVVYSGKYHSLGKMMGKIGDFRMKA